MTPFWISSLPSGSFACSAMVLVLAGAGAQFLQALAQSVTVERCCRVLRQCQRALVVSLRQLALIQSIQPDRQIVGIVGIGRGGAIGLEVGLLGVLPATLLGIQITQCKMHGRCIGIVGQ